MSIHVGGGCSPADGPTCSGARIHNGRVREHVHDIIGLGSLRRGRVRLGLSYQRPEPAGDSPIREETSCPTRPTTTHQTTGESARCAGSLWRPSPRRQPRPLWPCPGTAAAADTDHPSTIGRLVDAAGVPARLPAGLDISRECGVVAVRRGVRLGRGSMRPRRPTPGSTVRPRHRELPTPRMVAPSPTRSDGEVACTRGELWYSPVPYRGTGPQCAAYHSAEPACG